MGSPVQPLKTVPVGTTKSSRPFVSRGMPDKHHLGHRVHYVLCVCVYIYNIGALKYRVVGPIIL